MPATASATPSDRSSDRSSVGSFVGSLIAQRRPGHALPGPMYAHPEVRAADVEHVWHREWVFAGAACEVAAPGAYLTLTVGDHSLLVVRGADGVLRAFHNVCRHRGALLCDDAAGTVRRKLVCPYHQWVYDLDGRLAHARSMQGEVDAAALGLRPAHLETAGGLVYVCVADEPPPFAPYRALAEGHLAPYTLDRAKVAHTSTLVERGNWKLVWENNRECYHCRATHPELTRTFPEAPLHSGGGSDEEVRRTAELAARCERLGLPSDFRAAPDRQYRVMRMALDAGATSMTMDGGPAVAQRFPALPDAAAGPDLGDVLHYHYPSTWTHLVADHAITFRVLPLGPTTTELRTTWLVPADAVEGVDYDLDALTRVWLATNAQDAALVERAQRGVSSPAFVPGPYSRVEEEGVDQFVGWYLGVLSAGLLSAGSGEGQAGGVACSSTAAK